MRFAVLLVPEVGRASAPDLTRYLVVCATSIAALLALAWLFRRYVAKHVRSRAAKRSLQVLEVLPLSGKQKLVVVRCYDRSFLLGLGEKEVRAIAELDGVVPDPAAPGPLALPRPARSTSSFSAALEGELVLQPAPNPACSPADPHAGLGSETSPGSRAGPGSKAWIGSKNGVLA